MQPLHRSPHISSFSKLHPELRHLTPSWIPPQHRELVHAAVALNEDYVIKRVYFDKTIERFRDTFGEVVDILGWQN